MSEPLYIRTSWERAGAYDEQSQSFTMRTIPAPPEARAVVEESRIARAMRLTYEIRNACPHCLKTVIHRWDYSVSDTVRENLRGEWPAFKAIEALQRQVADAKREAEAAMRTTKAAEGRADQYLQALWSLTGRIAERKRKAKATEAQRRKQGDRRRRNAR